MALLECRVCGASEWNGPCRACAHALPAFLDLEERTQEAERKERHYWDEIRLLLRKCTSHMEVNEDGTTKIPDEIVLKKEHVEELIDLVNQSKDTKFGLSNSRYLSNDIGMLGITCCALDLFNPEKYRAKTTKAKIEELYKACEQYVKYEEINSKKNDCVGVQKTRLKVSVEEVIQTIKDGNEEEVVAKR